MPFFTNNNNDGGAASLLKEVFFPHPKDTVFCSAHSQTNNKVRNRRGVFRRGKNVNQLLGPPWPE